MEKGQVTIEMILIFGVFILLIFAVSVPTVSRGEKFARDIQFISDAKFATEQLATLASSVSNPYEKRNVGIYMPGYTSAGNASNNLPLIWMAMCTATSGSVLNTTVAIVRRDSDGTVTMQETYSFSKNLGRGNWKTYVNTGSGYPEGLIIEDRGRTYNITLSWENITSNTVPRYLTPNNCSAVTTLGV